MTAPHPNGFDYELPPERIAQSPAPERDGSRLLLVQRHSTRDPGDARVRDLPALLRRGDLLVVNRSRVIAARLFGERLPGGGQLELLLVAPTGDEPRSGTPARWRALARPARRLRTGQRIALVRRADREGDGGGGEAQRAGDSAGSARAARSEDRAELARAAKSGDTVEIVVEAKGDGWVDLAFPAGVDVLELLSHFGETPLPPYIHRTHGPTPEDAERYQTVFAAEPGSIAAPTAGLHLTRAVLDALAGAGVGVVEVCLHVGPATFLAGQPGRDALAVEPERFVVPESTRAAILGAEGRVIAVGTTTTRALESAARQGWPAGESTTDLVLRPGDEFEVVQGLLTNFHLPGSSLLALVSAFAGVATARTAYEAALRRGYRFYSYGDAMLVL